MPHSSETVGAIFAALSKAQAQIQNPTKNAVNPHFKSKYTTLDEGLNVAREALTAVGLCIHQRTFMEGNLVMLETILGHTSGEWLSSYYPVIAAPFKPQDGISSLTYARRAALFAAVGIAGEDDDGNAANKAGLIEAPPKKEEPKIDVDQLYKDMKEDLNLCATIGDLDDWAELYRPQKNLLKKAQQVEITSNFNSIKEKFKETANV
jgi:hypothetical protein